MYASDLFRDPHRDDPEVRRWRDVAAEVAAGLALDVGERDAAGQPPFAEAELLRRSGLLTMRIPVSAGGGGASLRTGFEVLRTIAHVDGSIAHVLGYHENFLIGTLADAESSTAHRIWQQTVEHRWLWASTGSPQDAPMQLTADTAGWRLSGQKTFATGSRVADRIVGFVRSPEDDHDLVVLLDPERPEFSHRDDWDPLGQRLSASNGLELRGYLITAEDVAMDYGPAGVPRPPYQTLGVLFSQLLFSQLCSGMAEGALAAATDYLRSASRPWFHADVERATDDPYALELLGDLVSSLAAVAALNEHATSSLEDAYRRGPNLTSGQRSATAELITASRIVANRCTLDVAARLFDLVGARATARRHHLDLAWRNIRTLTLHDPSSYKRRELGDYMLNQVEPQPSPYR